MRPQTDKTQQHTNTLDIQTSANRFGPVNRRLGGIPYACHKTDKNMIKHIPSSDIPLSLHRRTELISSTGVYLK